MSIIALHQVSKTYQVAGNLCTALDAVNFQLNPGERVAIMGASGSGKTTLMNILGLLDHPTTGHYYLNGQAVNHLTEDERAALRNRTIGFVFQSFFLLPRLSILQNVSLPLHYRQCDKHEIAIRAQQMLAKVGLAQLTHHKPNQLSGGQQQRAAIARALVGNPAVILADEPTGALDSQTGQLIMDLFIELNELEKVTTIIVTHDPKIAEQCQRIVHIQDGKIIE
jgi:putative ABC transport system ATP-binding protein